MDLEGYLRRIGYRAEGRTSRENLERLVLHHTETMPFENLSPLLGEEVSLDIESLEDKMVRRGRGGYCFEQNLLFWSVLRELGYQVRGLGARVRWGLPSEVMTPRGHMLLLVPLDAERYVVDVGFGLLTLTAPVALVPDVEQQTPHGPVRITTAGDCYELQARSEAQWRTVYLFDLAQTYPADYEMFNWFYATHRDRAS
jgi:N-hydroxyarylamine O-acetyltransferase